MGDFMGKQNFKKLNNMIKYKVIITYRDDKNETFDCVGHPQLWGEFLEIMETYNDFKYIPKEAIQLIEIKKYWSEKSNA